MCYSSGASTQAAGVHCSDHPSPPCWPQLSWEDVGSLYNIQHTADSIHSRASNEPSRSFHSARRRPIIGRAFSLLKVPTRAFMLKNVLRHYATQPTVSRHVKWTTTQSRHFQHSTTTMKALRTFVSSSSGHSLYNTVTVICTPCIQQTVRQTFK